MRDTEKPRPERDRTDESLRVERKNADQVMVERLSGVEETADLLVERAREQADSVLDRARDKADERLGAVGPELRAHAVVVRERAEEDRVLEEERAVADEALRVERMEQARALAALLPLEREKTDRYLLTERNRSDDALAHRDDFMGMVSHDLRSLLSGIVMNAGLVEKTAMETDEGRRAVVGMRRIHRYVARMNRLIGDLVDVVSLDAGKLQVQPGRGDVAALVREAVDAFAFNAAEQGIALEARSFERSLEADFDHDRMLQVLANIIANALKFTAQGGTISIRGERVGAEIHLSIGDTGAGIPGHMLEAVFERFWQVGKGDQRGPGLGLGLYISRCIVEAHDGKIWVESTLGAGSRFHVSFPAQKSADTAR
jgi:signal transduction histidine kinase